MQLRSQRRLIFNQPAVLEIETDQNQITPEGEGNIEAVIMADNQDRRTLADYAMPGGVTINQGVVLPEITAPQFELRNGLIQMMQLASIFHGFRDENPHSHIYAFLEMCGTTRIQGMTEDAFNLNMMASKRAFRIGVMCPNRTNERKVMGQRLGSVFLALIFSLQVINSH